MKYNDKYDLYLDDDFIIYYWDSKLDKLMQSKIYKNGTGYFIVNTNTGLKRVHRIIYETFVGTIPDGYEIDHINTICTDNRLENLRCVTHTGNMNNPITLKHMSKSQKGNTNARGNTHSEFGIKFKDYYGITRYKNIKLYRKEHMWYLRHGKCRWE